MLEYTDRATARGLMLLVHHDDAEREAAYDRDSKIGKLDTAWDKADREGLERRQHEGRLEPGLPVRGMI